MRFLGIGETNDLGDMYLRLMRAGHEVRVFMSDEDSRDVMQDMLTFTPDWRADLNWIRESGKDGIVLFETASHGEIQDELRREGYNVIGGSALGDKLEQERGYAQQIFKDYGLSVAASRSFTNFDDAIAFLRDSPRRCVFKMNGSGWRSSMNYVGQMHNAADMVALLTATRDSWSYDESPDFLLMEYVAGVEVGVGAFFNGDTFLDPPNLDWEHKRFFPGDIGELTGEMGTVVTYRGAQPFFNATLRRLAPMLRESGYVGYINLNTIVNAQGIWPLELTCRFGYPGFPILDSLHAEDWGSVFAKLVAKEARTIETRDGFSVGVVLTVPTFPYSDGYSELGRGIPVCFDESMSEEDLDSLHYGEVTLNNSQLVTAGMIGYVMVVTGTGATVHDARNAVYQRVGKVVIPNARYRNDIGVRFMEHDEAAMKALGWL